MVVGWEGLREGGGFLCFDRGITAALGSFLVAEAHGLFAVSSGYRLSSGSVLSFVFAFFMRNKKGWYQNGFSMGEFLTFFLCWVRSAREGGRDGYNRTLFY